MKKNQSSKMHQMQERVIDQDQEFHRRGGVNAGRKFLGIKKKWYEKNLGRFIYQRMKEENITRNDLDEDTINFFFQQFKVNIDDF